MVCALAPGVVVDEFYSTPASRDSQFGQASRPGADQVRVGHQPEDRKATMDPLTDIYNRRHFEVLVSREFARAQRQTPEVLESLWEQSVIRSLRKVSQENGNDDTGADSNVISFPDRKSA